MYGLKQCSGDQTDGSAVCSNENETLPKAGDRTPLEVGQEAGGEDRIPRKVGSARSAMRLEVKTGIWWLDCRTRGAGELASLGAEASKRLAGWWLTDSGTGAGRRLMAS